MIIKSRNEVHIQGELGKPTKFQQGFDDKNKWMIEKDYVYFPIRTEQGFVRCIAKGDAMIHFVGNYKAGNPIEIKGFITTRQIKRSFHNVVCVTSIYDFFNEERNWKWTKF